VDARERKACEPLSSLDNSAVLSAAVTFGVKSKKMVQTINFIA